MAYQATGQVLEGDQIATLVALSRLVDLAPGPGGARITPAGDQAAVAAVLGRGGFAQFVILSVSQQISRHCDPPIRGRRFHIPLVTNAGCWSFHGGSWQQLEAGACYEMDPTVEHGAVNWGAETRLHLMIDIDA